MFPYEDENLEAVELGASIFVKVNKNLWRAVDEFGLERVDFERDDDGDDTMGIWDGHEFALTVSRQCVTRSEVSAYFDLD